MTENCDSITSLAINGEPVHTGVMSFIDEATVCAEIEETAPTVSFLRGDTDVQDLKEYFRRPRLIANYTMGAVRSSLFQANVNVGLLFTTWFPNGAIRLSGVQGVRFTMKFSTTIASSPFHQGVLALSFQRDGQTVDVDQFCRSNSNALCTQLPHVKLDLAEHTMVSLEIPWFADLDYLDLSTQAPVFNYGVIAINQILPTPVLASAGAPTGKVYLHLEDLELIGSRPYTETLIVAQSGDVRSSTVSTRGPPMSEVELRKGGVLSNVMGSAANLASAVGRIPPLRAIGGTAAWALASMSKAASALGYSKPRVEVEPHRMYKSDYVGDINVDMPNPAFSLGAFATNKLRVDSTFPGTETDEMAFSHILSKYSQIAVGEMNTSDPVGTRLYATQISPFYFWYRSNLVARPTGNLPFPATSSLTTNAIQPSILCYFAQMFRQWRGGLKFRFHFAKTKFHAGRVIIGFVPGPVERPSTVVGDAVVPAMEVTAAGPQPFSYCKTFDLRDSNIIEFDVDYISPFLYTGVNGSTGGLTMTVLDPLIANGESSTNIQFLVEVCAKDDFEFAFPAVPGLAALTGNSSFAFIQSGVGANSRPDVDQYTSGERILSVKQLIMMPNYTNYDQPNAQNIKTSLPLFSYYPRFSNTVPMALLSRYFATSRAALASMCYAYFNGSTSYHVYRDGDDFNVSALISYDPSDSNEKNTALNAASAYTHSSLVPGNFAYTNLGAGHYECPTYSRLARVSIRSSFPDSDATRNFTPGASTMKGTQRGTYASPQLTVRNTSGRTKRVVISYAAADDARLCTFIGVPPIYIFPSTQSASVETTTTVF
jgi:hypothetical protein